MLFTLASSFASIAILTIAVMFLYGLARNLITNAAPFIPVPAPVLDDIVRELQLKPTDTLFDLGCGDARVLIAAARSCPNISCIGIDRDLFALALAKSVSTFSGAGSSIKIRYGNFYKTDISKATRVFVYLYPEVMDSLLAKFESELPQGALLVSCDFGFTVKKPIRTVPIPQRGKYTLGRTLYVYQF